MPVYNDRYKKTKIKPYGDKVYINFRGFNVPEDDIAYQSFIVISIDSWLVYENKYLDNWAYKMSNKRMTDYIDNNRFED